MNADEPENHSAYIETWKLLSKELKFQPALSVNLTSVYSLNMRQ
jgi:hypothetical protein